MNVFQLRPEWKAFLLALAGSVVLIVGMGYGRFAYTGILPLMLNEQVLTLREGNLAASANYAGYLAGALLLAKARPTDARWLSLLSALLTLLCLALLAVLVSPLAIIAVRGIAGLLSAVTLIAASLCERYRSGADLGHLRSCRRPLLFSLASAGHQARLPPRVYP